MIKGQIISGDYNRILIRKKSDKDLELGEILIAENNNTKVLLQVFDLIYGSQLSQQNLELISGLKLEEKNDLELLDPNQRTYILSLAKPMISITNDNAILCKSLPPFFTQIREITKQDLSFLTTPSDPLFIGKLRSGSKLLDVDIFLPGKEVLSHHILIPATTGRGKSNLTSVMLWNLLDQDYAGILVLDPHDEYYGRNKLALKDHPKNEKLAYYTSKNPPSGCKTLKINIRLIRPQHFQGVVDFSDPQRQLMNMYYKQFGDEWIEKIVLEIPLQNATFKDDTLAVVKRNLLYLLDLEISNKEIKCKGIFDNQSGMTTVNDIAREIEQAKIVIIDTSNFAGTVELLIGSLITTEIFKRYKNYKITGELDSKPVVSIILEEAPRVLGKDILEKGSNIFSTIAREGRKFKVGLTAITQLPSLIPRDILANMNTKIILGVEMKPERQAIIESASQDLSDDDRNIASLDKGEAIITSNFTKFATPIKIPLFSEIVKNSKAQKTFKKSFNGISLS